ncbi:MAG: hypothetical protein ACRD9W_24525, partial [Terriglobia bacterium]
MAKLICVCPRQIESHPTLEARIRAACNSLAPDNINPAPPTLVQHDGVVLGIFNPNESISRLNVSVCLGTILNDDMSWAKPLTG